MFVAFKKNWETSFCYQKSSFWPF